MGMAETFPKNESRIVMSTFKPRRERCTTPIVEIVADYIRGDGPPMGQLVAIIDSANTVTTFE
jgi:methyl coenzyme M reductase subunit C